MTISIFELISSGSMDEILGRDRNKLSLIDIKLLNKITRKQESAQVVLLNREVGLCAFCVILGSCGVTFAMQ